jgi:hypothetical protein
MNKKVKTGLLLVVVVTSALVWTTAEVGARGNRPGPVIFVRSQGLWYDSIVTADPLPPEGPFQELFPTATEGQLETELGPGDPGYVGGRWVLIVGWGTGEVFFLSLAGTGT